MPDSYLHDLNTPRCPAVNTVRPGFRAKQCVQPQGHPSWHRNADGYTWNEVQAQPITLTAPGSVYAAPLGTAEDQSVPPAGWQHVGEIKDVPAGQSPLEKYLRGLVTGGKLQARATSPYRNVGVRIYRNGSLAALAVDPSEAQRIVGGTAADPLWKAEAEALREQARYWLKRCQEAERRVNALPAEHARELADVRRRHERATAHIARLKQEMASDANTREIERLKRVIGSRDREITRLGDVHRAAKVNEDRFHGAVVTYIRQMLGDMHPAQRDSADRTDLDQHVKRLVSRFAHEQRAVREVQQTLARVREELRAKQGHDTDQARRVRQDARAHAYGEQITKLRRHLHWPAVTPASSWTFPALVQMIDAVIERHDDLKQRAGAVEQARSTWQARHGQLAGDALHLLRRLNTLAGERDAVDFTRSAANATMDKVLGLRKADTLRILELEEQLEALRTLSQCPHLAPGLESLATGHCVRVNGHNGVHISESGVTW